MSDNIINDLLEEECVEALLRERLGSELKLLSIKPIKKHIWHTTYHVVFRYTVKINGAIRQIFVTAHDQEPREVALKALEYLYAHGFGQGNCLVPEPLFYDKKYNATFYFGLNGDNLYHYIKENNREEVKKLVIKTAKWLSLLHGLPVDAKLIFNKDNAKISTVSPGVRAVLEAVCLHFPQHTAFYNELYRYFIENENKNLDAISLSMIHGDAHPENVIRLNSTKIGVIDFVDMAVGDRARDVGTFLQQLGYMANRKINDPAFTEEIKDLFLTTYLKSAKLKMSDDLQKRIDLYYDWTAIRTATYFLIKHDPEPERAEALITGVKQSLNIK